VWTNLIKHRPAAKLAMDRKFRAAFFAAQGNALGAPDPPLTLLYASASSCGGAIGPAGITLVAHRSRINTQSDFDLITRAVVDLWLDAGAHGYPGETVREIDRYLLVIRGDDDMLVSRTNAVELADRVNGAKLLNLPFAGTLFSRSSQKCCFGHCGPSSPGPKQRRARVIE